jgi:hypothetical protein
MRSLRILAGTSLAAAMVVPVFFLFPSGPIAALPHMAAAMAGFWPAADGLPPAAAPALPDAVHAQVTMNLTAAQPVPYRVRSGDALSLIAAKEGGKASLWPELWWANRAHIRNPAAVPVGMALAIPAWRPLPGWMLTDALAAIPRPKPVIPVTSSSSSGTAGAPPAPASPPQSSGIYSYAALETLWESAGGPSSAAPQAAQIAICESGGNPAAFNPSGAAGLWQILGQIVGGNIFDPMVNALNAVAKFRASGDTFAQWVCQ